jgi:hypothetical protein
LKLSGGISQKAPFPPTSAVIETIPQKQEHRAS